MFLSDRVLQFSSRCFVWNYYDLSPIGLPAVVWVGRLAMANLRRCVGLLLAGDALLSGRRLVLHCAKSTIRS